MLTATDFKGEWQVDRQITDRMARQTGRLIGVATFTQGAPDQLIYQETGQLRYGDGPVMQATRSYVWQFTDNQVVVRFEDGSPFHSFVPDGYATGTDHPCGDDTYSVRYDFIPWPRWRAVWVAAGPRKDYTSVTEFTR